MSRSAHVGLIFAGAWALAGGLIAAVNSAAPIAHGSWLAAYWTLVGGIAGAALLIGSRQLAVRAASPTWPVALWNAGVVLVPAGVLAAAPVLLSAGSLLLLAALCGFSAAVRRAGAAALCYRLLALLLAASVIVGSALGGAPPGSWL